MNKPFDLFDMVALTADLPERGLVAGLVGTVVEPLGDVVFEVEFSDDAGRTYAMAPIRADRVLVLRYARERRVGLTSHGSRTWFLDWSHQWAGS